MNRTSLLAAAAGAAALLLATPGAATTEELIATQCSACHGAGGQGVVPTFPKLAGQQAAYLAKELDDYLARKRRNDPMENALTDVKAGDVAALAAYYAAQKPAPGKVEDAALAAAGKKLYESGNDATGVAACAACHGDRGEGSGTYPRLAGQYQAYLIQTLNDFKSGARRNDQSRMMRVVAQRMTESEIKAVAEYIAGL